MPDRVPRTRKRRSGKAAVIEEVVFPSNYPLLADARRDLRQIRQSLGLDVIFIFHGREVPIRPYCSFDDESRDSIYEILSTLPKRPVAVVLDSPGGDPHVAYQMATAIRNHCESFTAIIPSYAKSAATLFCMAASEILMAEQAQLGPLDMQVFDRETEDQRSVLEYVQALERLEAYTLRLVDDTMQLLMTRTGKKVGTLLPHVIRFATSVVRPLYENVDVVQYTQMARLHKVVEDYAARLLSESDPEGHISRTFTSDYADHGFIIDLAEAQKNGLNAKAAPSEIGASLKGISRMAQGLQCTGVVREKDRGSAP